MGYLILHKHFEEKNTPKDTQKSTLGLREDLTQNRNPSLDLTVVILLGLLKISNLFPPVRLMSCP